MFRLLVGLPNRLHSTDLLRGRISSRWASTATPAPEKTARNVERGYFTQADDDLISRRRREGKPAREIAEETNRTQASVEARMRILMSKDPSLRRRKKSGSGDSIDRTILDGVESGRWLKDISKELGLHKSTVTARLRGLKPSRNAAEPCRFRRWTAEDHDQLRALYLAGKDMHVIASSFGRTPKAVKMLLHRLGITTHPTRRPFTAEDDRLLQSLYASGRPMKEIGGILDRHPGTLYHRLASFSQSSQHPPPRPWIDAENKEVLRLWEAGAPVADIAQRVNRSKSSIYQQIKASHLRHDGRRRRRTWTVKETETLLRLHDQGRTSDQIALIITGRSVNAVRIKLSCLKNS